MSQCLVAADAATVTKAQTEKFRRANDVIVFGPTEERLQELVERAARRCDRDLLAGATAVDLASLTDYTLFVYAADIEEHDGLRPTRRSVPSLIRYSRARPIDQGAVLGHRTGSLVVVVPGRGEGQPARRFSCG